MLLYGILMLIGIFVFIIPICIVENDMSKQEKENGVKRRADAKIEKVLDTLESLTHKYDYKVKLSEESLRYIREKYLPSLYKIDYEYLYEKYIEQIKRSIDFSKSFRTEEATKDFLANETKLLFDAFETELIKIYNHNKESEETSRTLEKALDKAYDEELLKRYKSLKEEEKCLH